MRSASVAAMFCLNPSVIVSTVASVQFRIVVGAAMPPTGAVLVTGPAWAAPTSSAAGRK